MGYLIKIEDLVQYHSKVCLFVCFNTNNHIFIARLTTRQVLLFYFLILHINPSSPFLTSSHSPTFLSPPHICSSERVWPPLGNQRSLSHHCAKAGPRPSPLCLS